MAKRKQPPVPTPLPHTTLTAPPPPTPPPVRWRTTSLVEWRRSKQRTEWAAGLLRDPQFAELLAVLRWQVEQRERVPMDQLAINLEFGRGEGRRDVLDWIEQAAQPLTTPSTTPLTQPDYGVPAVEEAGEDLTGFELPPPPTT